MFERNIGFSSSLRNLFLSRRIIDRVVRLISISSLRIAANSCFEQQERKKEKERRKEGRKVVSRHDWSNRSYTAFALRYFYRGQQFRSMVIRFLV